MSRWKTIILVLTLLILCSICLMGIINVKGDYIGLEIAREWCFERGINGSTQYCINELNSPIMDIYQGLSLGLFLSVIAFTVLKMEWRLAAAMIAVALIIIVCVVPPQYIVSAVSWNLVLFLIGAMTLAGVLRELGVFRYLAIKIVMLSKGNPTLLIILLGFLSYGLAAVLDEVTSIVYVVILVLELSRVLNTNLTPLIIFSVLATNTGSSALPIGNPIGVYLLFATHMEISMFIRYSLPLSLINIVLLILVFIVFEKKWIKLLKKQLIENIDRINAYIERQRIELEEESKALRVGIGLIVLSAFVVTIALNDYITHGLSIITHTDIDSHTFLSFIPYVYLVILLSVTPMEEIPRFVEKSVEWSSILFFVFLFMLSHSLTYSGAMAKLAYVFSAISTNPMGLITVLLLSSTGLSAVLDNLSVVVTYTPIVIMFNRLGITNILSYFALLFGGVFGGNYTPIGSTANIVALGLAEKRRVKITWRKWLKLAVIPTTLQVVVALLYLLALSIF